MLSVEPHPLLHLPAFSATLPAPVGELPTDAVMALLRADAPSPLAPPDDALRGAVRDLLRHGGYKPTGRGKPASEYLVKAVEGGTLGSINLLVDACNVASLHSGFPISVVDLDRARGPFRVAVAPEGASYVFNAGGQTIDLSGLLCLWDAEGPCANAVKDSQRTKTHAGTTRALVVVWGLAGARARAEATAAWSRTLLEDGGARTAEVPA